MIFLGLRIWSFPATEITESLGIFFVNLVFFVDK